MQNGSPSTLSFTSQSYYLSSEAVVSTRILLFCSAAFPCPTFCLDYSGLHHLLSGSQTKGNYFLGVCTKRQTDIPGNNKSSWLSHTVAFLRLLIRYLPVVIKPLYCGQNCPISSGLKNKFCFRALFWLLCGNNFRCILTRVAIWTAAFKVKGFVYPLLQLSRVLPL